MSIKGAIGIIETKGFVGIVEAADAMLKSANVTIVKQERIGAGLVAIVIEGDIGSVRVAADAGVAKASEGGKEVRATVIANPHNDLSEILSRKV